MFLDIIIIFFSSSLISVQTLSVDCMPKNAEEQLLLYLFKNYFVRFEDM